MSAKKRSPRYWLFKSEADCYSIQHLAAEPERTTFWDGVRNYQARNMLRDDVQVGDGVLFYHSNSDPLAVVGACRVTQPASPDMTAFDADAQHYDPKSRLEAPTWFQVHIQLVQVFPTPVTRDMLKADPRTQGMGVLAKGSRLSILPVTAGEWTAVHRLGGVKPR